MEEKIKNKNMYRCHNCDQQLWRFLDDDTVHIFGTCGQYIINFNSIEVVCKKCGKRNYVISSGAKDIKKMFEDRVEKNDKEAIDYVRRKSLLLAPYHNLTVLEESRVVIKLTTKQTKIFDYLMTNKNVSIDKIMQKFNLNERTVMKDVDLITNEIIKIKPNFKQYYKTPCYLPEIRKKIRY